MPTWRAFLSKGQCNSSNLDLNFENSSFYLWSKTPGDCPLDLEPRASDKEGHERCRICFRKRLRQGFEYAAQNGFNYYGTVMTISRYKNAKDINTIGEELQKEYPTVKWLYADFKKNDGYEKSLIIIKEHEMYFQEYCGCKYSYEAYKKKHLTD